jgi:TIR domain-containing protein
VIDNPSLEQLSHIVMRGLSAGEAVEIEGLGAFHPDPHRFFRFEPAQPKVFIAYVQEDRAQAELLATELEAVGFAPWIDLRQLLPGQNWPRAIEIAIETSSFFLACFSAHSVVKKGGFQAEIRYALDCARQVPLDEIFIVPLRLNGCPVPRSIQREFQYVDLFPNWPSGMRRLVGMMRRELERRARNRPAAD